jgi:malonyl-CoA O-methyltransferase
MKTKGVISEFSKNAKTYDRYNIIQKQVAKKLLSLVKEKPKKIIDLGSGSGEMYKLIDWEIEKFLAIDISKDMCSLHPMQKKIEILNTDFEKDELYKTVLKDEKFDYVFSSASLQWSVNLKKVVKRFSEISNNCAVSIFCDGTFKTIYEKSKLKTFLPSYNEVINIFSQFYKINYKREFYKLYFDDNISKFRYIKRSGVSGGKRKLGYKETKKLIETYPLDYLEFEVLYITGAKCTRSF